MRSIAILLAALLLTTTTIAQTKITGYIVDSNQHAVESATASLFKIRDSSLVNVAVSDKSGSFEFDQISPGDYFISITAVGFIKTASTTVTVSNAAVRLPAIRLQQAAGKTLGEVTVTAKRPLIENKIDRMVVNVEAAPTNAGASAMEVLEKSPGISVSNEGAISLKGKQGVIVMMDGKPTYLSPADLANVLKNMPASALDQIEIMTNPPARYDASGNSGIINIKTKKSRNEGLNGSITQGISVGW